MSYNVDTWNTKEISNLILPVASLFKHERSDWHPEKIYEDDGNVTFRVMEGSEMTGRIEGKMLLVTKFTAYSEGSGTALHWIFEPALKESTGRFVAVRIWEGGDSIDCLTVDDGKVTSEPIEL